VWFGRAQIGVKILVGTPDMRLLYIVLARRRIVLTTFDYPPNGSPAAFSAAIFHF
jgi:hypothetical protein